MQRRLNNYCAIQIWLRSSSHIAFYASWPTHFVVDLTKKGFELFVIRWMTCHVFIGFTIEEFEFEKN